jgi:hypothetical protein
MSRAVAALALLCIATSTCRSARSTNGSTGGETASTSALADAGDVGDRPHTDPLGVFLEAAQTNLERPYPASLDDSRERYARAAQGLEPGPEFFLSTEPRLPSRRIVMLVLARSNDTRAARALMEWTVKPVTPLPEVHELLTMMSGYPRTGYLETVKAILANQDLARHIVLTSEGELSQVMWMSLQVSLHVTALELAVRLPGDEGRALVRSIALDRAASGSNPLTLAALTCPRGWVRVEAEAQALASLRVMALSVLADRALMRAVAADPREPPLVRQWAQKMSVGRQEKNLDARQRRALESAFAPEPKDPWSPPPRHDYCPCMSLPADPSAVPSLPP